jgi:hypothetical protein
MATLTALFAQFARWARENVNEDDRYFAVTILVIIAVVGFVLAIGFLAGAVG